MITIARTTMERAIEPIELSGDRAIDSIERFSNRSSARASHQGAIERSNERRSEQCSQQSTERSNG